MGNVKHIDVLTKRILVAASVIFVCVCSILLCDSPSRDSFGSYASILVLFSGSIFFGSRVVSLLPRKRISSEKKAVLITGCDSGFGHELAKRLHANGFQVFAACMYPETEGGLQLRLSGLSSLHVFKMDVTKPEDIVAAKSYVKGHLNGNDLWAVVNNAGIGIGTEIELTPMHHIEKVLDVNLLGVIRVTKAFLPFIRKSRGRIVNVASSAGRFPFPSFVAYGVSKHAVISFSEGLRLEMHKWGVQIITIEPWLYRTPFSETSSLIKQIQENWTSSTEEIKDAYDYNYIQRLQKVTRDLFKWLNNPNVEDVINIMEEAVFDELPKYRYSSGKWYLGVFMWIMNHVPYPIRDFVLYNCIYFCCTTSVRKPMKQ